MTSIQNILTGSTYFFQNLNTKNLIRDFAENIFLTFLYKRINTEHYRDITIHLLTNSLVGTSQVRIIHV